MKNCPFCAEEIQEQALKCKHCGEWLAEPKAIRAAAQPAVAQPETVRTRSDQPNADDELAKYRLQYEEPVVVDERPYPPVRGIRFNTKMCVAWVFAALWLWSYLRMNLRQHSGVPVTTGLWLFESWFAGSVVVRVGVALQLIRKLRGTNRNWQDRSDGAAQLSVWGWTWRAMVATLAAIVPVAIASYAFPALAPSTGYVEGGVRELLALLSIAVVVWLLFSRDRRGQIRVLFSALRGF